MNRKSVFIVILLLAAGGFLWWSRGDSEQADLARRLTQRQNLAETNTAASSPAVADMFRLSGELIADRDPDDAVWTVRHGEDSFVELPFLPPKDGALPEGAAVADSKADENPGYLGAEACAECHLDRYAGFVETAHHLTSGLVVPGSIRGHFDGPGSQLASRDPALSFQLLQRDEKLLQRLTYEDWQLEIPMDVFTGSAKTGQTMLYWHGDALYQAHVSYLSKIDSWISSPGFTDTAVFYSRVIRTACLECHMTYIDLKQAPNHYHRDSAIWGISCERCHGPGKDHVDFHRQHADEKSGRSIIQPTDLPREQQLQICAQCHSGSFKLLKDAFTFVPGQPLEEHHQTIATSASGASGIHTSNQLTRLKMSKCFQQSEMTCTTCHDPHQNQHGQTALFTQQCFQCHEVAHCGMSTELGDQIADDCIRCHMPIAANEDMLDVGSDAFSVEMVDHYIRVVSE